MFAEAPTEPTVPKGLQRLKVTEAAPGEVEQVGVGLVAGLDQLAVHQTLTIIKIYILYICIYINNIKSFDCYPLIAISL